MKYLRKVVYILFLTTTILYSQDVGNVSQMPYNFSEYQLNKNLRFSQNSDKMLDSVITMTDGARKKHTMTYNSKGAVTSQLIQSISYTLRNVGLLTYEYDDSNRIASIVSQNWESGGWTGYYRQIFTYDSLLITDLSQSWDASSNSWVNYNRRISDTNVRIGQTWDWSLNDWKNSWRETKEKEGDYLNFIYENWIQDEWKKTSRTIYKLDAEGNFVKYKNELWSEDDWWLYYIYEYGKRDDTTSVTSYRYLASAQTFKENERQTCVYDDEYLSYCFNEIYDTYNYDWRDGSASIKVADSFGNELSFTGFLIEFYYDTPTDISEEDISISNFSLSQNYPNPFNPSTIISFELPQKSEVNLTIYNTLGQVVATLINEIKQAGQHQIVFDASDLPNGVYIYRIKAGSYIASKKMILLK